MESRKKSPPAAPSAAAGTAAAAAAAPPPANNGYFSAVFSTSPAGNPRDAKQAELYAMLNKPTSKGQNGGGVAGNGKPQGRTMYKDGKQCPNESSESPYFGSSVHYGGREFYGNSPQKQPSEPPRNYKEDNPDGSLATRGDWWQGSLYY